VDAAAMIASGEVHLPVSAVYPLPSIKEAVAHAPRGGKVLLEIGESSA
jgi:NADPH:quinone reductase-like Zn-dependent oxidoreductase